MGSKKKRSKSTASAAKRRSVKAQISSRQRLVESKQEASNALQQQHLNANAKQNFEQGNYIASSDSTNNTNTNYLSFKKKKTKRNTEIEDFEKDKASLVERNYVHTINNTNRNKRRKSRRNVKSGSKCNHDIFGPSLLANIDKNSIFRYNSDGNNKRVTVDDAIHAMNHTKLTNTSDNIAFSELDDFTKDPLTIQQKLSNSADSTTSFSKTFNLQPNNNNNNNMKNSNKLHKMERNNNYNSATIAMNRYAVLGGIVVNSDEEDDCTNDINNVFLNGNDKGKRCSSSRSFESKLIFAPPTFNHPSIATTTTSASTGMHLRQVYNEEEMKRTIRLFQQTIRFERENGTGVNEDEIDPDL